MSIRWIRNVIIDDEKSTVEIQLGERRIGDKCYVRVGKELEQWFTNRGSTRDNIIAQGIDLLQQKLTGKTVLYPDGREYDWN